MQLTTLGYREGIKVLEIYDFATQNWTITPVTLAGNKTPSTMFTASRKAIMIACRICDRENFDIIRVQ
jgi:hypothetical protein